MDLLGHRRALPDFKAAMYHNFALVRSDGYVNIFPLLELDHVLQSPISDVIIDRVTCITVSKSGTCGNTDF